MKKTTAIACAIATAAMSFSGTSLAQDRGGRDRGERVDRGDRDDRRDESRRDHRNDRNDRFQSRVERREDRRENRTSTAPTVRYESRAPAYNYQYNAAPRYSYGSNYGYSAPRYVIGGYVPNTYRAQRYYVNDWRSYNGLYAPPYGYQWVQTGTGDFLLMALATGLIANLLMSRY